MNTSENKYDSLESMIFESNLKIVAIDFHKEINTMLVVLNTGAVLNSEINLTPRLANANTEQLNNFTFIGNGTGIHWESIDEDISLKGLLQRSIQRQLHSRKEFVLA